MPYEHFPRTRLGPECLRVTNLYFDSESRHLESTPPVYLIANEKISIDAIFIKQPR
jgi:hypothetical protein